MKPKKVKDLLPGLAEKLQLSEREIKSVLDIYWSHVRKTLSSLEHNKVYMRGLGTFYTKPWAVNKKIEMNQMMIKKYTQYPSAGSLTIINELSKDIIKLEKVKEREVADSIKKANIKYERRNQDLEGEG